MYSLMNTLNYCRLNEMTRNCQLIDDQLDQSENAHRQTRYEPLISTILQLDHAIQSFHS